MSACVLEGCAPAWKEADRLAALRGFEILDTVPEAAFNDIATLVARMCNAPIAVINFIDEGRQWFKSEIGLGVRETPLDISICAHAILQPGLFVVPDTTKDPRFSANPLVRGEPHLRFYAGALLETDEGLPLGTLCVLDYEPRPNGVTKEQGETLLALARSVMSQLKLRRSNKALEEHQRELAALTDALPQMVWSARSNGQDDYCNKQWYDFTGAKPGSPLGENWISFIHPADRERTKALWQRSLREGVPYEDEYRLHHHSGEYRWVLSRGVPVQDTHGRVARWLGTNTDIHDWKKAEHALVQSEERYRALVRASAAIVWRAAPDGTILEGSGWETFCGQGPEVHRGHGWLSAVHPDDVDQVISVWQEVLASKAPGTNEYRVRHINGEYRWVLANAVPLLSGDGVVQEWVGTITDIHDHKQAEEELRASEERLRLAIEATSLGIWDINLATGERRWTPEARDILGFAPDAPITPETFLACVHPEDRDCVRSTFAGYSPSCGVTYNGTFRIIRADTGEERWIAASGRTIVDEQARPVRQVGTAQDITERKRAEAELAEKAALLRATLENMDQGLIMADAADQVTVFNRRALDLLDLPHDFLMGKPRVQEVKAYQVAVGELTLEDNPVLKLTQSGNFLSDPSTFERTRPDGTMLEIRTVPLPEGGAVRTDITARRRAEGELRASEERLRLALQAGRMVAWEQDLTTNYITRSPNSLDLLGIGSGPLSEFLERVHLEYKPLREQFLGQIKGEGVGTIEFRYRLPGGKAMWLASRGERAGPNRVVGVSYDITERKEAEQELWWLATHDPLTGLPNRSLLHRRLEEALADAQQTGGSVSLLLIDLDNFKEVNDSFGHDAGDALLKEVAQRLSSGARECDTVARLSGDEFAILLTSSKLQHAATLAEGITRKLGLPFSHAGQMLISKASIGVASFPDHDSTSTELMKDADLALYRAKDGGRSRVVTYLPEMRAETERRIVLRREMRKATSRDEIVPFYQPKISLSTGEIVGFEALARWQHPTQGLLTPATFGAAFDDPELATMVGKRLIGKVASDIRRWLKQGLNPGRVAINLSHAEFVQPGLAEDILRILDLANVPARHFEIEITEKVLLDTEVDGVLAALEKFRSRGVLIALDDFGTGYASLAHLKQFPVDHLKIDQSFVRNIEQDTDDNAIVAAVVGLGRSLNLQVTAEGVESIGQAQRLREMGCGTAQGYLYAKPVAGAETPELLKNWAARLIPAQRLIVVER